MCTFEVHIKVHMCTCTYDVHMCTSKVPMCTCIYDVHQKSACAYLKHLDLLQRLVQVASTRMSPFWGDTIWFFFSFETENPLICRQRPFFFFFFGHHILSDWKPTRFAAKTFFLVFTFILDKGCHHEILPRVPPILATPLSRRRGCDQNWRKFRLAVSTANESWCFNNCLLK